MNILVIDTGTSSMRGILYNSEGRILHSSQNSYQVQYPRHLYAEQNPDDWKYSLITITRKITSFANEKHLFIGAVALTCQRSSVIPVDCTGTPLSNAVMWMDKRTQDICDKVKEKESFIFSKTGSKINTVFSASKMTWIRENLPEIYKKTYKFLTIADYLTFLMTGNFVTDYTYGSRSLLMNLNTKDYDSELMDLFHIDRDKLCPLIAPGDISGKITHEFSKVTGLPENIPLISAGGDQQCAALGHGVIAKGNLEITTGTGAYILAYIDKIPTTLNENVICQTHAIKGKYVLESSILTCASSYNWAKNLFYSNDAELSSFDTINKDVALSVPGSNGCLTLPYFQGRGTPDWNVHALGMFYGLSFQHTKGDIIRSILESTAYELDNNLKILKKYIGKITQISIGGGLSSFDVFNQIQADVYQKELIHYNTNEQTSLGAFINASVSLGLYPDYERALTTVQSSIKHTKYFPISKNYNIYKQQQKLMNHLYKKLFV